jgi:predicted phosphodiesterase
VLAGGHTHIQMLRQHRGMLLVNPGSVGMPFREFANGQAPCILPYAEYAIIEGNGTGAVSVQLHRVAVDKTALRNEAVASANPICRALEKQYA